MPAGRTAHSGSMTSTAPNPDSGPSTKSIWTVMPGSACAWERNRNDRAAGEVFDRVLVSPGHHGLELLSHRDDPSRLPAVGDRLLERGEDAAPHDDDDDVVEGVCLGLHRPATKMLAQDRDDAGGDLGQEPSDRRPHSPGSRRESIHWSSRASGIADIEPTYINAAGSSIAMIPQRRAYSSRACRRQARSRATARGRVSTG